MANIHYTELFYSLQGEGRFVGVPSVFLRTFGCNFRCNSFGCPTPIVGTNPEVADIIEVMHMYNKFEDLPLVTTGCDSYSTVYPEFKKFAKKSTTEDLVDQILALTPNKHWVQNNGNDVHLVITGGEPLLGWQRAYKELLSHPRMSDLKNITFETNGTQPLHDDFKQFLMDWQVNGAGKPSEVTFSVSAKLSASGETWEDAIKPEIVAEYQNYGTTYLKFVVETQDHVNEAVRAVDAFRAGGFAGVVYLMPVGGTTPIYDKNEFNVAKIAMDRGYYYSPRLHLNLFGNSWGT